MIFICSVVGWGVFEQTSRRDGYEALARDDNEANDDGDGVPAASSPRGGPKLKPRGHISFSSSSPSSSRTSSSSNAHAYAYAYAYGPPSLAGLQHNPYTALSALLASLGGLLFGYDQGVLAGVLVMRDFEYRFGLGRWGEGVVSESDPLLAFPVFVRTRC